MQSKKNQSSVGLMIQRCHKWRQKRKQYMDMARQTADEIERERLMQTAEHYGRIVNAEQGKIDSTRGVSATAVADTESEVGENSDTSDASEADTTDDPVFPDFITDVK